jgi:eukaryotic-like serine/threonine-protein kinase
MAEPRTASPTRAGSVLAGRYELRGLIGRGGMGEVYETADLRLDRTVAVKVLRGELAADRRFVARFHREARTAARLAHPGIVGVFDFGEADGVVYLVLEHVAGRTLTEVRRADRRPAPARVARIGAEVADALAHAHARGVVHRDVAPGNVMLTPDGVVKVLDFGIAGAAIGSGHGSALSAHGTLAYAAPEVLTGGTGDQRVDIYGVGAILYELLVGRPPFVGGPRDVAKRLRVARPVPPHAWEPSVPPGLEETVTRCLERDPGMRGHDAASLADELRRLAAYLPESATASARTQPIPPRTTTAVLPVAGTRPLPQPRGRRRWIRGLAWALIALIVVSAAALVGPSLLAARRPIGHAGPGPHPLPAPSGVTATASCDGFLSTGVDVGWAAVTGADGYEVWRRSAGGETWGEVTSAGSATGTVRDTDLGVDTSYIYRVRAVRGGAAGLWSDEITVGTPLLCLT